MSKLSVTVVMRDEAANIGRCLESVSWADEIVVIDAESKDASAQIARRYTDKVVVEPWRGFGPQKNLALEHATHEWVFSIDSDEEVTPQLAAEIQAIIADENEQRAFLVSRLNFFCGRFLRFGGVYPDRQLRLFRRDCGRFSDRPVHETFLTSAPVGVLQHDLLHYSYPSLSHLVNKLDVFSTLGARHMFESGKKASFLHLATRPAWKFLSCYLIRQGWRDGRHGFLFAAFSAIQVFVRLAKLWELQQNSKPESTPPQKQ